MDSFWIFADHHPFWAWCMAWGLWIIPSIVAIPFNFAFRVINRRMRARNIAARGCPTNPLMDADGDIVHPKVATDE